MKWVDENSLRKITIFIITDESYSKCNLKHVQFQLHLIKMEKKWKEGNILSKYISQNKYILTKKCS